MKKGTLGESLARLAAAKTAGDVMDALFMCDQPSEVQAFMEAYRKTTPHADSNIHCMLGHYSAESERVYSKLMRGETPDKYDGLSRADLIAQMEASK